jgi:hypothetical protein
MSTRGRGLAVLVVLLALAVPAAAAAGGGGGRDDDQGSRRDRVRPVPADVKAKVSKKRRQELAEEGAALATAGSPVATVAPAVSKTPPINTVRPWFAVRFDTGGLIAANFTLRGVGKKIEVWVQNARSFPAGDCRNTNPVDLEITDAQVTRLIQEFDTNMHPREAQLFSTPPDRDGSDPEFAPAGFDFVGDGDKIVTLVMNIRDENYYDTSNANGFGYVVGYHSSTLNEYTDRNIMTIDAFDWLHRSGASPANEPVTGADAACKSRPAFPFRMESTFAHEYQHLLEYYASPGEVNWVNEGLSDYAMRKTGYGRPEIPQGTIGSEGHIQCFYGNLGSTLGGVPLGGPENSLTIWEDQGGGEVLCDYGAAWSFMEYLEGQFGERFLTALHNEDTNGLPGFQTVLDRFLTGRKSQDVVHDWLAAIALDNVLDEATLIASGRPDRYRIPTLAAGINWESEQAYASPGAPPNGADFVRLRDAAGTPLKASEIRSISFSGQRQFDPTPVEWKVVDGALSADLTSDLQNRTIGRQVTVPAGSPTLTFKGKYDLEAHWDYGFVQVSTDGGKSYASVACSNTASDNVPNAHPLVSGNVPGYSGLQDAFRTETCDLTAYAGRSVIVLFRAVSDWGTIGNDDATDNDGWFVDDVTLGGVVLSDGSSLAGWKSETELYPVKVAGWTVQLLAYDTGRRSFAVAGSFPLKPDFNGSIQLGNVLRALGDRGATVAAVVTYDEPTEAIDQYARYELRVNGQLQAGG